MLARALAVLLVLFTFTSEAAARTVRIVAFGDSLTEGLGLPKSQAFPAQLEAALRARGHDVEIVNAGVSGETAPQGLARLDWSIPAGTDAVIVELGANDMLRGQNPDGTRRALTEIVRRLKAKGISVLLAGMRAAPNLGADYALRFDPVFPEIAAAEGVLLYPFFLDAVAGSRALNQPDGLHPNARGVAAIVAGILPKAEALIAQVKDKDAEEKAVKADGAQGGAAR
ncbi:arylesterase [Xanthobacter sp. KR7-225]|uniref:arylesterase n=1 Tax=Xanthobacter sp. KR7-225 TaxID=3156613 RepID=UPI0032B39ED9